MVLSELDSFTSIKSNEIYSFQLNFLHHSSFLFSVYVGKKKMGKMNYARSSAENNRHALNFLFTGKV